MNELLVESFRKFSRTTAEAAKGLRVFLGVVEGVPIESGLDADERRAVEAAMVALAAVVAVCEDIHKSFGRLLEQSAKEN